MKKLLILGLCLLSAAGLSAQKSLVKEVEGKTKGYNTNLSQARKDLAPALKNPESKDDAQTWFVAGNIEFGDYDDMFKKKAVGENPDPKKMGKALIDGYNYFMIAFPLDSVAEIDKKTGEKKLDKEGKVKVKTKYSKDMAKKLAENHNQYLTIGQTLWDVQDYNGAYEVWNIYTTMPFNKSLGELVPPAPDNNTLGQIYYFEGLAAWQANKLDTALTSFDKAVELGYKEPALYDYAISVAAQKNDTPRVMAYANTANDLYGDSISKYLTIIINENINQKEYDSAQALLEKAIKVNPSNPEFYDVMGILYQSQNQLDEARKYIQKAVELAPDMPKANLDLGRVIYAQAIAIDEASSSLNQTEYNKVRDEKIDPLLKEAAPYLEKALKDDNTFDDARRLLRSLYYSLNDDENLKRIEAM